MLLKFHLGRHEQYTENMDQVMWMDYGYGMMALHKSDWDIVGGNYLSYKRLPRSSSLNLT